MIRAGEAGGILESVLRYLTEYLESTLALKEDDQIGADLSGDLSQRRRPFVDRACFSSSFRSLPRFFMITRKAIPWITKVVIGFSQFLLSYGWLVLLVIVRRGRRRGFFTCEIPRDEANGIVYA